MQNLKVRTNKKTRMHTSKDMCKTTTTENTLSFENSKDMYAFDDIDTTRPVDTTQVNMCAQY